VLAALLVGSTARADPPSESTPQAAPPAAPAPSSPARRGPDLEPGSARTSLVPYGPGASIEVISSGKPATLYVVKWAGGPAPLDAEFTRIGITPVTFQLPEGTYLLEAEGPDVTRGSKLLEMRGVPKRLVVDTGSEGLGTTGGLMMGFGSVAILAGVVMLAGGTASRGSGLDKPAVAVPLLAGGAGLLGGGIAFYFMSRTELEDQPAERAQGVPAPRAAIAGLRCSF
jgi:hypothetical protein